MYWQVETIVSYFSISIRSSARIVGFAFASFVFLSFLVLIFVGDADWQNKSDSRYVCQHPQVSKTQT